MNKTLGGAAALFLLATRIPAHHAFAAEYDETKIVMVAGTVREIQWTNPHAWLYISGRDENGSATSWAFEMGSPGGLVNRGWKKGELKKGDRVSVDGFASKTREN